MGLLEIYASVISIFQKIYKEVIIVPEDGPNTLFCTHAKTSFIMPHLYGINPLLAYGYGLYRTLDINGAYK